MLKNEENNGTGEMGLVTPIPGLRTHLMCVYVDIASSDELRWKMESPPQMLCLKATEDFSKINLNFLEVFRCVCL